MKTTTTTPLRVALAATLTLTLAGLARAADAPDIWKTKCAACHAPDGKGKPTLKTKDYTSADVQAKMTDDEIVKAITDGVTGTRMSAYKDKLTPDEIKSLTAYIRTLKK